MTSFVLAVYRATLRLYPRAFRREYRAALVQAVDDRLRHGPESPWRVLALEVADGIPAAIRMRGDTAMRTTIALTVLAATAVAVVVVQPAAALLVVAVAAAVVMRRAVGGRSAAPWAVAAAAALVAAIAIPTIDGDELSEPWWAAMALLVVAAVVLAVVAVSRLLGQPRLPDTADHVTP